MAASNPPAGASPNQPIHPIPHPTSESGTAVKTSSAAAFALVFGVAALFSVLTVILSAVGLLLGIIGIILAIIGMRMSRRPGVTGRGLAIGGLILSILAVLVALAFAAGITTFLNNEDAVDRLDRRVEDLRDKLPR
ncbi:hypothetical protein JNW91_09260 [Micromonospora sp. STR1_7]|uniref:DUF4190 domain-containing protein n=1 Tax=Micromonospora parastrephiae TaxID=2806101 RepID=A0ABS1XS14_9ACTN|nr:hypothetical protein [Micromonospora parastrephiae]MBM0232039.1 hypothetical protein [Micromonospora parastrephiae]